MNKNSIFKKGKAFCRTLLTGLLVVFHLKTASKSRMLSRLFAPFVLAIIFYSCEKNDEQLSSHPTQQVKEYTFDDIIRQPKFNKTYRSFISKLKNRKAVANRNIPVRDADFKIDSTTIKEITAGDVTTYTMGIIRPQATEGYFENLVVKVDEADSIKAYIIQYFPDKEAVYNLHHHAFSFSGTAKTKEIVFDASIFETQDEDAITCSTAWMCDQGGDIHPAGGNCTQTFTVTFCNGNASGGSYPGTGTSNPGGTGGVNTNTGGSPIYTSIVYISEEEAAVKYTAFYNQLSAQQKEWLLNNSDAAQEISNYLWLTNFAGSKKVFAKEAIDLAMEESNLADGKNLLKISLILERGQYETYSLDANFLNRIDSYVDLDLSNQDIHEPLVAQLIIKYHVLQSVHPNWSKAKLFKETFRDLLHTGLDLFGLAPVIGEPADLISGIIYTLEGDHLNAGLSYASAIPVTGWVTAGAKFGLKVVNSTATVYTIATKVKLTWKMEKGILTFGQRSQLRKVLGMATSNVDPRQAHHIIPWENKISSHVVVQKAAKSGSAFHMNEALNGIAVAAWRNQPNHNAYNERILSKLEDFKILNPNATPAQCYNYLNDIIQDAREAIINNPNTHLNDLIF